MMSKYIINEKCIKIKNLFVEIYRKQIIAGVEYVKIKIYFLSNLLSRKGF